jgi:hypothetical protein
MRITKQELERRIAEALDVLEKAMAAAEDLWAENHGFTRDDIAAEYAFKSGVYTSRIEKAAKMLKEGKFFD